ncbi:hypothetical protein LCGC14_2101370 [marine sediment metagenome]|uniref:Uncharacterized protein n=1 Tax=marine sediment metagenome TaxID=412755 RepID=A0A0F9GN14_9ZZZZ
MKQVKASLRSLGAKGWTVLLECGHTLYDIRSKRRPKSVACILCKAQENR